MKKLTFFLLLCFSLMVMPFSGKATEPCTTTVWGISDTRPLDPVLPMTAGAWAYFSERKIYSVCFGGDVDPEDGYALDLTLTGVKWRASNLTIQECQPIWYGVTTQLITNGRTRILLSGRGIIFLGVGIPSCTNTTGIKKFAQTIICAAGCFTPPPGGCPIGSTYENGVCCPITPIIIDTNGDGFHFSSVAGGVNFNYGDVPVATAWTLAGTDDGWLVLDRNSNGTIDNGGELFGNFTAQPVSADQNGYKALLACDGPKLDGKITYEDTVFSSLRIWCDTDHDGVSDAGELQTLAYYGITELGTTYTENQHSDQWDNVARLEASVVAPGTHVFNKSIDCYLMNGTDIP